MNNGDQRAGILIVDDKPDRVLALEAVLEDLGQRIVRAYSGREALRCALNDEFAVILLDVNMPDMDGFETASMIRQRPSSRHIPIIFLTAFGDEIHMARSYRMGAVDYIQIPVIPEVLQSKVSVFVELHQKTAQLRHQSQVMRRRAMQLQKLSVASLEINSAAGVDQMLNIVADSAADIVGSHQCIAMFLSDVGGSAATRISWAANFSERHAKWRNRDLRLQALASTIIAQKPTLTRLAVSELRDHPDWEALKKLELPPIHGGLLSAPLTGLDGKNMGLVLLLDRLSGEFTAEDESLLTQMAQITSIAIQNSIFAQERHANRVKDEFLATLSHELRTPLSAISGWTQLLRMQELPEDARHGVEVIERNVGAQIKLIEDLLDVSRIATGKMRLNLKPVSLDPIVQAAIEIIRPAATVKNIELVAELAQDIDMVGDADRLQQVAWNLLSNAVKFTPANGQVRVTTGKVNSHAQICVSDTGMGIDPGFVRFVFDRFRQGDSTSSRSHGGLGIGLTIVRHIVELHGGTVVANSPGRGQGAMFTVMLPLSVAPAALEERPAPRSLVTETAPIASAALDGRRVLLVDDEADAREMLSELLRRAGADVSAAASVREAFECISRVAPDILVSDIGMPEQDGYALIEELRRMPAERGGRMPAIALTAYAHEEDRRRALRAGFQAHLTKPVEAQQLLADIARLTANREEVKTEEPAEPMVAAAEEQP
jgi:signal transduction histidine kinase/CheY-like chemotaxis protein